MYTAGDVLLSQYEIRTEAAESSAGSARAWRGGEAGRRSGEKGQFLLAGNETDG